MMGQVPAVPPPTRFLTTQDQVRIAWCSQGEGSPLVFVRGWLSHLEDFWENPRFRAYFEPLTRCFRLVRYDMRGNGLSDQHPEMLDFEATVRDLETVMDGLGLSGATLYGQSFGGPTTIAYTARHPDRVARLILDNTYARGHDMASPEQQDRLIRLMRDDPAGAMLRIAQMTDPDPQTALTLREHYRGIRRSQQRVSADVLPRLYELGYAIDVRDLLPAITVPTLVMHRCENRSFPLRLGRELASRIADVRFVALPGSASNPYDGDAAASLAAVGDFLGVRLELASVEATEPPRGPATCTVLFTDIVGHTEMMRRLGDAKGRDVLRDHERITRESLKQCSGTEVKTDGDSFMASFATASAAVECAVVLQRAFAEYSATNDEPIVVRMGLHAGEPIEERGDLFGSSVIMASRIKAQAEGGEILVSDVVHGLLAGKPFIFADRGEFRLKGFDDPVRLYEVRWREG